ncbi:hypothetical protein ACP70R_018065 [Stipagrostis hirtigluma subsp. patula]
MTVEQRNKRNKKRRESYQRKKGQPMLHETFKGGKCAHEVSEVWMQPLCTLDSVNNVHNLDGVTPTSHADNQHIRRGSRSIYHREWYKNMTPDERIARRELVGGNKSGTAAFSFDGEEIKEVGRHMRTCPPSQQMHPKKVRISFADPDATDSDSGDDASSSTGAGAAVMAADKTTEIVILLDNMELASSSTKNPGRGSKAPQSAGSSPALAASAGSRKRRVSAAGSATKRRFRGVYERQPGRWAAEFRSHRLKVRHWLGTYATEEEAKAAYDAFEAQQFPSPHHRGGPPPASERRRGEGGSARRPSSHPPGEMQQVVQALAMTTIVESSSTTRSASATVASAPSISALTSPSSWPPAPVNAQSHVDELASADPFLARELADEELIGLADLANLPLPFFDGNMDLDLREFDNGFF